jgi:AcrR family transcriptional regulator
MEGFGVARGVVRETPPVGTRVDASHPEAGLPTSDSNLAAAAAVFWREGYTSTTPRKLAEALGVKEAELSHRLRAKELLLSAICEDTLTRVSRAVAEVAAAEPPEGRLQAMIRTHIETALRDGHMHATMLREHRYLPPGPKADFLVHQSRYERVVEDAVRAAQDAGRLREDIASRDLALALVDLLNGTIIRRQPSGDGSARDIGKTIATIFFEGAATARVRSSE